MRRPLRIAIPVLLIAAATVFAARPALSSRGVLARGFLTQPDNGPSSSDVDALERQPNVAIYPGTWVSVAHVGDVRTRQAIEFGRDGRFTTGYTMRRDAQLLVDESSTGTYAVHGRTVTFETDSGGSHVTRRVGVKVVDGIHLVLLTPSDAPLSLTRIFDRQSSVAYAP